MQALLSAGQNAAKCTDFKCHPCPGPLTNAYPNIAGCYASNNSKVSQQTNGSHVQPAATAVTTTVVFVQSVDFCTLHMSAAKVSPGKSSVLLADNAALREAMGGCSGPHAGRGAHTKPAHGYARGKTSCVLHDTVS